MKRFSLFFLITIFLLGGLSLALAEERELETHYPTVPGAVAPTTVEGTQLPEYVKYIFNFAIIIAGAIALGVVVLGGIRWLTSAGDPTKLKDAKEQIFAAFLGLIILLSSWLILMTINPQLVILEPSKLEGVTEEAPPGVWLCQTAVDIENQEQRAKECFLLNTKRDIGDELSKFNNKIKNVHLVGDQYGVILFEDKGYKDDCQILESSGPVTISNPSSAIPFLKRSSQGGIILYEKEDFEGQAKGPFDVGLHNPNMVPCGSMQITEGGGPFIIALGKENFQGGCKVFDTSQHLLIDDTEVGKFCGTLWWRSPCVKTMEIVGGVIR